MKIINIVATRAALQIHDRSPKSRPVASLNQSQTQMTRPVATAVLECNAPQMSDSKAKMHQIQLGLGLRPGPAVGAYSAPPDSLAGLKGPTFKGRGGERWKRNEGRGPLYFFLPIYTHG